MYEILATLAPNARVLDLGCGEGSFPCGATTAEVFRVDFAPSRGRRGGIFIGADAACLPFADRVFDAVIANHSLEHMAELDAVLSEIRRVVRVDGSLFVSVPDASTLTDKLYRWLARGGGHVNGFRSASSLATGIESATGLRHAATKTLYSSLSFLNRHNRSDTSAPRRLLILGGGTEASLWLYVYISRRVDRIFSTRLSIYGWALYFGPVHNIDSTEYFNVCIRCGSGCPDSRVEPQLALRLGPVRVFTYRCPECGATNPFFQPTGESANRPPAIAPRIG